MKIKKITKADPIISIDDNDFAVLVGIRNNMFIYNFTYSIDTKKAIDNNALSVKIGISANVPSKPQSMFAVSAITKKLEPLKLVKNIQQLEAFKKDTKNANLNAVIKEQISDITTSISNSDPNGKAPTQKTKFNLMSVKAANQVLKEEPILQKTSFVSYPIVKTLKSLAIGSILKDKQDPGEILSNFSNTTKMGFQGLSQIKATYPKGNQNQLIFKIVNSINATSTKDLADLVVVPIVSKESTNISVITKTFYIDATKLSGIGEFQVKFDLIDKNGLSVQKVSKKIDHSQNVLIFQTPIVAPHVSVIKLKIPGKNILEITQNDENAKSVSIYRKEIKKTKRIEDVDYSFVKSLPLTNMDGPMQFEDLVGNASDIIYRVIPVGAQQQLGSVYRNVVAPAVPVGFQRRSERLIYAGVVGQVNEEGIQVEVLSVAPGVSAIKLLVKDRTIFEKNYRVVNSSITKSSTILVSDANSSYLFLDTNVKFGHVYEYCVSLLFENGDEEIATGCDFVEYIPFSIGVVDISLSQPRILQSNNGLDVQFSIKSTINDNDISVLKKLLENQGFEDLFKEELLNEKDSLNKLIAHSIRRIDLSNGKSEHFNVFTDSVFKDSENRAKSNVSPLKSGRTYRYIVNSLLRTPETLFENNKKTINNKINISVKYLPLKFKHPVVLNYGNIVSPVSLKSNHSKSPFEFGAVGNYVSKDVTLDISRPNITNAKVIRFNRGTNIVRWNVLGEKSLIDHFLIVVERMGSEEIIGKTHTIFNSNVIQYIDKRAVLEPGSFRYKIIPVQKNYDHGSAVFTDEVVV